jgi:hypothetical protein
LFITLLLSSIGLPAWGNPEDVNDTDSVISLEYDPKITDSKAKAGPTLQWNDVNVSSIWVLGQFVQVSSNTPGLLTRHSLQGFDGLPLDCQLVWRVLHALDYSGTLHYRQGAVLYNDPRQAQGERA